MTSKKNPLPPELDVLKRHRFTLHTRCTAVRMEFFKERIASRVEGRIERTPSGWDWFLTTTEGQKKALRNGTETELRMAVARVVLHEGQW